MPPLVVQTLPARLALPWSPRPGARLELWRVDLLDLDRPDVGGWLAEWAPRPGLLARRMPVDDAALAEGRVPLSRPGAYILRQHARGETHAALVLASRLRLALLLEDSDLEVLCADARSGQPVQGAFVKVAYRAERLGVERVLTASGTTDATGRWRTSIVRDRFAPSVVAAAAAVHSNHYALATARRSLDHSDADVRLTLRARSPTCYQGQAVELTGVVQQRAGRQFTPLGNAAVRLTLLDPKGRQAGVVGVRTSVVGAFTDSIQLARDAQPGPYRIVAALEGRPMAEPHEFELFSVVPPRRPPFRVEMSLAPPILAPGADATLTLRATAADGKPLVGARVRLLSWGYPVPLEGRPAWVRGPEPIDPARVAALPLGFPREAATGADGSVTLRCEASQREALGVDLLCAVQAAVEAPPLGRVVRTAELVALATPPPIAIGADSTFQRPGEPFSLSFSTFLPPDEQKKAKAVCTLRYEDRQGRGHTFELLAGPVAELAAKQLAAVATRPGRYAFAVRVGDDVSEAVVWVAEGDTHLPWRGAHEPMLVTGRPWCRRDQPFPVVVAAPSLNAPVALTLRSATHVERRSLTIRSGARALELTPDPRHSDPIEITLFQVHEGQVRLTRTAIGVEPGGKALDVAARLFWVRKGEWSGSGYGIAVRDRLGKPVQSIVHTELFRPSFRGDPPVAVQRRTIQWHGGSATNDGGEMELRLHQSLLEKSHALYIAALAPDGRAGAALLPAVRARRGAAGTRTAPRGPREKLDHLAHHGLGSPIARWLAARLVAAHPGLAAALPALARDARSDDEARFALRLAAAHPGVSVAALEAVLARGPKGRAAALAVTADFASDARPVLQRLLASDSDPETRRAAARILGRTTPLGLTSLVQALGTDVDPLVRAEVAGALANGGEPAVSALAAALPVEEETEVRLILVGALRRLGGVAAAEALLGLLDDETAELRLAAVRALGDVGYRGADPRLLRLLTQGTPTLRGAAAQVLAAGATPAVTRALCAAAQRKPTARLIEALGSLRSPEVQAAMPRWLAHDDPAVRLAAADHLAARNDARAFPVLRAFLDASAPPEMADRAARRLIAARNEASVLPLARELEAGRLSHETRRLLVRTAGELRWHPLAPALRAILVQGLTEPTRLDAPGSRALWAEAARALAAMGPLAGAAAEAPAVQVEAGSPYAAAFAALSNDGVGGLLRALWVSPLPLELRRETVAAFARLRGAAAVPDLLRLLESPPLQGRAARALAEIGAAESLLRALRSRSARTRGAAAAALGLVGDLVAVPTLDPLLQDADPHVRLEAAWALAAITRRPIIYTDHLGEPRQALP